MYLKYILKGGQDEKYEACSKCLQLSSTIINSLLKIKKILIINGRKSDINNI